MKKKKDNLEISIPLSVHFILSKKNPPNARKKACISLPKLFVVYIYIFSIYKSEKLVYFISFFFAEKYMFGEPISNGLDVPRSDRCTFRLDSDVQKSGEILSATYPGKNFNFTKKKEIREIKIIFYFFRELRLLFLLPIQERIPKICIARINLSANLINVYE